MKIDYKETFRFYKNLISFPHSQTKELCEWYQEVARFHPEDIKLRELTLLERIIKWLKKRKN